MDFEDSGRVRGRRGQGRGYRNWLGLMQGTLSASVAKGGSEFVRTSAADHHRRRRMRYGAGREPCLLAAPSDT